MDINRSNLKRKDMAPFRPLVSLSSENYWTKNERRASWSVHAGQNWHGQYRKIAEVDVAYTFPVEMIHKSWQKQDHFTTNRKSAIQEYGESREYLSLPSFDFLAKPSCLCGNFCWSHDGFRKPVKISSASTLLIFGYYCAIGPRQLFLA